MTSMFLNAYHLARFFQTVDLSVFVAARQHKVKGWFDPALGSSPTFRGFTRKGSFLIQSLYGGLQWRRYS